MSLTVCNFTLKFEDHVTHKYILQGRQKISKSELIRHELTFNSASCGTGMCFQMGKLHSRLIDYL